MSHESGILLLLATLLMVSINVNAQCVVDTPSGSARGFSLTTLKGRDICSYTGIPYAQPPVGDLRFRDPVPATPWSGELDATQNGKLCVQGVLSMYFGNEDCLYLNVFTTQTGEPTGELLPVLVYIHGGGFILGSGNWQTYGPLFIMDKDVIVVTMNYRLGLLGFFSTGEDAAPGNYGLKDQTEALRWIQNNIESFGGDPNRVTIMGESAGAMSVNHHILSPRNAGLFHGGIANSGSSLMPILIRLDDPLPNAQQQAQLVDCPTDNTADMVDCLRYMDLNTLMSNQLDGCTEASRAIDLSCIYNIIWRPTVEQQTEGNPEPFLPGTPKEIIQSGNYNKVPVLLGTNSQEGSLFLIPIIGTQDALDAANADLDFVGRTVFFLRESLPDDEIPAVWDQILEYYLGSDREINSDNMNKITDAASDRFMQHNVQKLVELYVESGLENVYLYYFAYRGKYSLLANARYGGEKHDLGVLHADELEYIISRGETANKWEEGHPDLEVVDAVVTLWTNFIITGNPTPSAEEAPQGVEWPASGSEMQYYVFGHAEPPAEPIDGILPLQVTVEPDKFKDRMDFWDSLPLRDNQ